MKYHEDKRLRFFAKTCILFVYFLNRGTSGDREFSVLNHFLGYLREIFINSDDEESQ